MINIFEHYFLGEKLYSQVVANVCKKYNLTYMEFTIIMFLSNNPKYDTASDIVKYRSLTKSHVSTSIRSLEEKGYLLGKFHGNDRRSIHLVILNKAKPIIEDGHIAQKHYLDIIHNGLNDEDKQKLQEIITIINNNINNNLEGLKNDAR